MWLLTIVITMAAILGVLEILLLRFLNKKWWQILWIRLIAIALPLAAGLAVLLWFWGRRFNITILNEIGLPMAAAILVSMVGLVVAFPLSGLVHALDHVIERRRKKPKSAVNTEKINLNRRAALAGTAAIFPFLALAAGGGGTAESFNGTRVFKMKMGLPQLPPELEGLTILQLSDSHLGIYRFLDDWEAVLTEAATYKPDLVLLTGDIADDLSLLPDTLKMTEALKPPYGIFASLGNHEYYRGVDRVKRIFGQSQIPLLISEGVNISVNGKSVFVAGADDPRYMNEDTSVFLNDTVNKAVSNANNADFAILMSHRPEGFNSAHKHKIPLTLAGHTHGGQVGLGGRSLFSNIMPDRYLWGEYQLDESRLYVSSGIGHWFPFRLGCPPEAPIIELIKSDQI